MTKKILSLLMAFAGLAQVVMAQGYTGSLSFTPVVAKKQGDSLHLNFATMLDDVTLKSRASLLLTPRLVSADGTHSYEFKPVLVGGRNREVMWRRGELQPAEVQMVRRHNGRQESIQHHIAAPYYEWMRSARLLLDEQVRGCAACELATQRYTLAQRLFKEPYKPSFMLAYITPEAEPVKVRADKFTARFNFRVNRSELLPNLGNNAAELRRVDSVATSILKNADVQIKNVSIDGYASPEGHFKANTTLSYNRAVAFVKYLKATYNLGTDLFDVKGHGEDWEGLLQVVSKTAMADREQVIDIIQNTADDVKRKQQLKALSGGATYARMLQELYPPLRRTEYQFTYQVRPFSIEEACVRIKTNPQLLSLNEMYLVANFYPAGSPDRKEALEKAAQFFPRNPVSQFNVLAGRLAEGKKEQKALSYLEKYAASAQQQNNLGVAYALEGDLVRARACFQKAQELKEAQHNLAELDKMEKN